MTSPWAALPPTVKLYEDEKDGQMIISGLHSNNVVVIRNCNNCFYIVRPNQRLHQIVVINCTNLKLWVLDSAVIVTQTTVVINCNHSQFLFEDVDMRNIQLHSTNDSEVILIDSLPLIEYSKVYFLESGKNNKFTLGAIVSGMIMGMNYKPIKSIAVPEITETSKVVYVDGLKGINIHKYPKKGQTSTLMSKQEHIDKASEWEKTIINLSPSQLSSAYDAEREEEKEIERKAEEVAAILKEKGRKNHVVCYTGAGISTSADIPDYRGPQGVWTLKDKGLFSTKSLDFEDVRPTYAHYAITLLAKRGLIHHVISTNMDALHLRSGLPPHMITEQHGNSYKEVCDRCHTVYYRQFDTHEGYSDHHTDRQCNFCNYWLVDTIVNFAENLHDADQMTSLWNARKSTVAIVMGTSMNVQPAASYPLQVLKNHGKLVIVNLQRTPFDDESHVRVFAKTDKFMKILLSKLGINGNLDQSFDAKENWSES